MKLANSSFRWRFIDVDGATWECPFPDVRGIISLDDGESGDIEEWRIDGWESIGTLTEREQVVIANVETDENEHVEGMTVAEFAAERETAR